VLHSSNYLPKTHALGGWSTLGNRLKCMLPDFLLFISPFLFLNKTQKLAFSENKLTFIFLSHL